MAPATAVLTNEIATTRDGRDITQPYIRGLREARDPLLYSAIDWGAYDEVLRDDQVFACLQQRIGAVVSRDWEVIPGDDDDPRAEAAAEAMNETIKRVGWDRVTRKMLYATFYGYSVAEAMWKPGDPFDFDAFKVRHARRFRYDDQDQLRMLTTTARQGELLPERKFWVHSVGGSDDDEPYGIGLAHWLYWPVLFKRNGLRFWNIFLDKFGTPTAMGKYPRGSSPQDIRNLLGALQSIAQDSGFVIPEGMAVELLNAARSGVGDYKELCAYMDGAIAKVILSQTMTTDNGSSRSQGEVHDDVKLEVIKSDADLLTDSFTAGPARWWTDFNFGADVAAPIVRRVVEEEADLKSSAETDDSHERRGWVRTADSFRETYGEGFVRKDDKDAPSGSMPATPAPVTVPPSVIDTSAPAAPERQPPARKPRAASFAADDPRPLYVFRRLLNAGELLDWATAQGFTSTITAEELHVTVTYSKRPVNWFGMGEFGSYASDLVVSPGGARMVSAMGSDGAVALVFASPDLQWRHREMREAGASWDYPSYLPHVTITYAAGDVDLSKVEPYQGRLVFGPETFEAIEPNWHEQHAETSFADPNDHDDADSIVDRMIAEDGFRVSQAMTGTLADRLQAATSEIEARALLAEALGTMDEGPLVQALERAGFAIQLKAASQDAGNEELR